MINELIDFCKSSVLSLIVGICIFIVGALFISDNVAWKIIKTIKPNIKKNINSVFIKIINIFLTDKVPYQGKKEAEDTKKMKIISDGKEKIRSIEKNIFVLDSLMGLFDMLSFIVARGFSIDSMYETFQEYFQCYCQSISQIGNKDLKNKIYEEFSDLSLKLENYMLGYKERNKERNDDYFHRAQKMNKLMDGFREFLQLKQTEQKELLNKKMEEVVYSVDDILEQI